MGPILFLIDSWGSLTSSWSCRKIWTWGEQMYGTISNIKKRIQFVNTLVQASLLIFSRTKNFEFFFGAWGQKVYFVNKWCKIVWKNHSFNQTFNFTKKVIRFSANFSKKIILGTLLTFIFSCVPLRLSRQDVSFIYPNEYIWMIIFDGEICGNSKILSLSS